MGGYIDATLYVIIASITFVLLTKMSSSIDPVISLFFLSGVAVVCFNLLGVRRVVSTYKTAATNWILCLQISIAIGLDWVFMLFASIKSDPFVAMGSIFVTLAILGFLNLFKVSRNRANIFSVFLLVISLILMACFYNFGNYEYTLIGIGFGFLAGLSFYFYIIYSTKLTNKTQMSPIQVLSLRFWVLFIGSSFFLPKSAFVIIKDKYIELTLISILSVVIPIFFNQKALQKLGSGIASVFFCFVPPVTYLFYAIINKNFVLINGLICMIITVALLTPKALDIIKKN